MQISARSGTAYAAAAIAIATCFVAACGGGASTAPGEVATNVAAPAPSGGIAPPASPPPVTTPADAQHRESLALVAAQSFEYAPAAAATAAGDPNDARPYTIANRPAWAEFDAETGTLSGTPAAADVGRYANVRIARGAAIVTLDIDVVASATGVARLAWEPPLVRRDGTPFDDVAGYRVYYGRSATQLTHSLEIDDPNVREAEIADLPRGTWYFVATAVDSLGAESDLSPPASKTIG